MNDSKPSVYPHGLAPGTRVLTAALRWVPIEQVSPGETLMGCDEYTGQSKHRWFRSATVEASCSHDLPSYELEFEDGSIVVASGTHSWLATSGNRHPIWQQTDRLRQRGPGGTYGSKIRAVVPLWDEDQSRGAGYLAAAFDGEGWIDGNSRNIHKVGFAQRDNAMWATVVRELEERGFAYRDWDKRGGYSNSSVRHLTVSTRGQLLRFLGSIRPPRLLAAFYPDRLGSMYGKPLALVRKTPIGMQSVIALTTSTRTFIAEGAPHSAAAAPATRSVP